ncbi:hypothetical protein NECAME_06004 [Necator americanus]|uniref:Uncharacterized protein n=1 Tax=Necator americanus TaxID=51031 RepID=W2TWW3_NECAM|nr:hypothetical protein NECAME_06004 [Necator americanus]ETN86298.1 hypothetical protein NECAME_06004 [Necator americanus]
MFGNSIVVSGTNNGFYAPYATNLNTETNGFNPNYINTNPLTQDEKYQADIVEQVEVVRRVSRAPRIMCAVVVRTGRASAHA